MAHKGQVLDNPVTGERIEFRETSADTEGRLLAFDLELSPDGHVPGAHVHPIQQESFEVLSGRVAFRLGVRKVIAGPGEHLVVPPGTMHKFANASGASARMRVEVRPALRMEQLLEVSTDLARANRTTGKGMPRPLDMVLFMRAFEWEVRAPMILHALVRATMAPLERLARRRGLDAIYGMRRATFATQSARPSRPERDRPPTRRETARPGPARPTGDRQTSGVRLG